MAKVKYMGLSDVRRVEAGEDFGGRLATPLTQDVQWDQKSNAFVVDTEEAALSDEAVKFLLEDKDSFLDVTGMERIPVNQNQATFLGMRDSTDEPREPEMAPAEVTPNPTPRGASIAAPEDQERR